MSEVPKSSPPASNSGDAGLTDAAALKSLVVEDDEDMRRLMERVLVIHGHDVTTCPDAESAWAAYQRETYSLVLLDWMLPGMDGLEMCKRIRTHPHGDRSIIVVITARDTPTDLQEVLGAGANDYVAKPVSFEMLKVRLAVAEQSVRNLYRRRQAEAALREQEETVQVLKRQLEKAQFRNLIGKSKAIAAVYDQIRDLAGVETTVLIEGETGTGKEVVARAIHYASPRKAGPFIAVNCAGLTDTILGSQLFGHKRGAFTGAVEQQQGFFEAADGGTIFLDEIGDVSPGVQTSLLRVLQEKEILRLGESRPRKVNVRVLAATHHNLNLDVAKGTFRADLLYRIRVARIQLPPLRDRRDDIPLLVTLFLGECSASTGKPVQDVSPEAKEILMGYRWPGNVRELRSAIESAVVSCKGPIIEAEDLPKEVVELGPETGSLDLGVTGDEKTRILTALERAKGNRTMAARLLGMSRATFYRRLTELNLSLT